MIAVGFVGSSFVMLAFQSSMVIKSVDILLVKTDYIRPIVYISVAVKKMKVITGVH